ncbi:cysteine desulfuration protein SufE [Salinibacterium amurskyense]|uniref:Cysteine desulfuration protein SufE n=1 Tax=Salinibacterium amurskyense TaxID=205941 RepID=A0A2M9D976_9MICO|nr:SufE family protein [Salinibacterium amurskyense]PJJ82286.1 cysteine desulfuration protein SufE [Salinibacterium amurskyense]RLQ82048.1 SufE family protein [Salinibacterium amurskyense]GHD77486.1 cysteine desufuration protein SufE [Salinibacterium amurskyense]
MSEQQIPSQLAEIRDDFLGFELRDRLQLLLEFANELPELPARYADHPDLFERVEECQSPVFIFIEVENDIVHMFATAPAEAPTTRGFASILVQGLSGLSSAEVLELSDDFPQTLGLSQAVSPLRLRGMTGMLARAKRQIRLKTAV